MPSCMAQFPTRRPYSQSSLHMMRRKKSRVLFLPSIHLQSQWEDPVLHTWAQVLFLRFGDGIGIGIGMDREIYKSCWTHPKWGWNRWLNQRNTVIQPPFVGISTVIRRIPHHGEMTIPLFSMTMVQMAATGRYLQGLMVMPMEMSSLCPACGGGTRGFSGTCEDRRIRQKRWFLWTNPQNMSFEWENP